MYGTMKSGIRLLLGVAALLIAAAGPAAAQGSAAAGRFIVVTGEVRVLALDGSARAAERNGEFRSGESILTGANGLAQLRMTDGAAVSVRADSQLKLDAYSYAGSEDRNASFFVSVLKGGFRTITGLIASNNRSNYRISTTSATMGVRGTHFEVVHVPQPMGDTAAGTYNRVYDGITTMQNRGGAVILVSREQTAFVALPSNLPPVLVVPPAGIFGKPTPIPVLTPQSRRDEDGKADGGKPAAGVTRDAPVAKEAGPATTVAPGRGLTAPLLNPIDSPRVMEIAPATTTISPTLTAPRTTTISPTLTAPATIAPATTTISPILTAPTTTTISPATTTISPILTAPAPTTTSPILKAPATTIQSPATSTIIKR